MSIGQSTVSNQWQSKWWVLLAVGTGTFMSALDGSVVNTILPVIGHAFGSPVATIEWVVVVYLLVIAGLLLTFGRLGDLHGHKSIYCLGFQVFLMGSVSCGLSSGVSWLVFFRAVQALGAAMLFANSPAILTQNFPPEQRGRALGLQGTMTYLGLTTGPSLGGWIAEKLSWRAVFYLNLPVGLLALALSLRSIPRDSPSERRMRFDLAGAFTFMCGLVAFLLSLNQGHHWGWSSFAIVGLFTLATLFLFSFLLIETRVQNPMLDLKLFSHRLFSTAVGSAILNYVCVYSIVFLLPFYLLRGRGLSPGHAGLLLTTQPLVMALVAPLSGMMSDRIGSRIPTTLGMGILALGLFFMSRLGPHSPLMTLSVALVFTGLGSGMFVSPNSSALMGAAPRHQRGIAAGILATARLVGMALGVGQAGAIFTTIVSHEQTRSSSDALFDGVRGGLTAASGIAVLGALFSAIRETRAGPPRNPLSAGQQRATG
jgi:EmrB/QacA subfamily drug resistance transporter